MARKGQQWPSELDNRRLELLKDGYSYNETALILSTEFKSIITKWMVIERSKKTNTTASELRSQNNNSSFVGETRILSNNEVEKKMFPDEAYKINEDLVFAPEKMRQLKEIWEKYNDGKSKKILSLSDLHAPFIDFSAVEEAIKNHSDADILMLNGDVFDGHALSDFDKLNDFDIEIEFKQVFTLLDVVTKHFKHVIWNGGNHDFTRFMRYVSRKFGQGMKKYVMKRLNPIDYIAEKYDNILVVPHNWVQIGKCIFTHPDGYSSALMSTAMNQAAYLRANKDFLPHSEFQAVVQGHTHDLGEYYVNGTKIIEQGSLCVMMDYRFDKPTSRKWVTGYAVVHLDNEGNVDFNESRNYIIK